MALNVPELRFPEFNGEWEGKPFGNICQIKKSKYNPENEKESLKCIELEHLSQNTGKILGYCDSKGQNSIKNRFEKGDVLFGKLRPYLRKYWLAKFDGVCSSEIWVFDGKEISNDFLFQLIQSNKFNYISNISSGSKMPRSDWKYMKHVKFKIPSLTEQEKTASFLSKIDEKIEKLEKKQELWETYKKGMMQKIFSQELRFKDENGEDYLEWEETFIDNIFNVGRGEVIAKTKLKEIPDSNYCYPVYSSQTQNRGIMGYYKNFDFDGDFLTWTTDGANAGKVMYRNGKFKCSNVCGVLKAKNEFEGMANTCTAEILDSITHKYVSYVGNPKLMNNVMAKIKIKVPNISEQGKIANLLGDIDLKIDLIKKETKIKKEFKKGLLQKMFC